MKHKILKIVLIAPLTLLLSPFVGLGMMIGFCWYGAQLGRAVAEIIGEESFGSDNKFAEKWEINK